MLNNIRNNIWNNKCIIIANFIIGLGYKPIFYFFLKTLDMPYIGLLFVSALICAILHLNALCYLNPHKWSTKSFFADVIIYMLIIFIVNTALVGIGLIVIVWYGINAIPGLLDPKLARAYNDMFICHIDAKCFNCAQVGIESPKQSGKHCSLCGVTVSASGKSPHAQIAKWALDKMAKGEGASIPNTVEWHKAHNTTTKTPLTLPEITTTLAQKATTSTSFTDYMEAKKNASKSVNEDDSIKKVGFKQFSLSIPESSKKGGSSSK